MQPIYFHIIHIFIGRNKQPNDITTRTLLHSFNFKFICSFFNIFTFIVDSTCACVCVCTCDCDYVTICVCLRARARVCVFVYLRNIGIHFYMCIAFVWHCVALCAGMFVQLNNPIAINLFLPLKNLLCYCTMRRRPSELFISNKRETPVLHFFRGLYGTFTQTCKMLWSFFFFFFSFCSSPSSSSIFYDNIF